MGSVVKRIVISGYYGFGNSGDEAVLQSILIALNNEADKQGITIQPIVLSIHPEGTEKMYGVKAVHRMKLAEVLSAIRSSDGLISGGGSLLQDATGVTTIPYYLGILKLAQWLNKPTFVYSQGIGPVYRPLFYPFIRTVINRCKYVSVRDVESAELLQKIGVKEEKVHVVPDPVMGLPLRAEDGLNGLGMAAASGRSELPVIGVAIRFWKKDRSDLNVLAEALRKIISAQQVELRFLPFHLPSDEEASRYVIERLGGIAGNEIKVMEGITAPQQMLAEVSLCDLMIGMRLHSLIYAASRLVPVIGISYDPKIDHFLHRLQMKAAAATENINPDEIAAEALLLLKQRQRWIEDKKEAIDDLKKKSYEPAQQIVTYLRNKG